MATPADVWRGMDRGDRYMLISAFAPLLLWWFYIGHRKYGAKGMR